MASATVTLLMPFVAMVNNHVAFTFEGGCCFFSLFCLMLIFSNFSSFILYVEMSVMVHSGVFNMDSSFQTC